MKIKTLLENLGAHIQKLEKKFPGGKAIETGVHKMSGHLQKEHGIDKESADEAAKNHHSHQKMVAKFSKPEHVSKDSSD